MLQFVCAVLLSVLLGVSYSAYGELPEVDQGFQEQLQNELIQATPGSVVEIPAGVFHLDSQLSLTVDGVTIRGQGMDKTILSFKDQRVGAEGLNIFSNGVVLEDFTIQDTKGDAIKITSSDGVTIRRVKTEWTGGPKTENGGYGVYPTLCNNVLIEDSVAIGASDSGVYVGQSSNIVVRRNHVTFNVAGIEIENSTKADVYDNVATDNSGGILVFNLPDLQVQGERTRVFHNRVFANNTANFSAPHNTVGDLPTGTGIMVLANRSVEVFANQIEDHGTTGILLVSYPTTLRAVNDPTYNPFLGKVYIYDNTLRHNGFAPKGGSFENSQMLIDLLVKNVPVPLPTVIYDGLVDPRLQSSPTGVPPQVCFQRNEPFDFVNLNVQDDFQNISRDPAPFVCELERLPPVVLESLREGSVAI